MVMAEPTQANESAVALTQDERDFALSQREALAISASPLVPKEFRGNVPSCLIALNMAKRMDMNPLAVMQSLYIVHGNPSFSASFLIACFNKSGRFTTIQYKRSGEGDERTWTACTTERETGLEIEGPPVSMAMAKAEGWSTKSGSKWLTLTDLMGCYRSATFLIRTTAPEITLGMRTTDELEDIQASRPERGTSAQAATDALANARDITPDPEDDRGMEPQGVAPDSSSEEVRDVPSPASDSDVDDLFGMGGGE